LNSLSLLQSASDGIGYDAAEVYFFPTYKTYFDVDRRYAMCMLRIVSLATFFIFHRQSFFFPPSLPTVYLKEYPVIFISMTMVSLL